MSLTNKIDYSIIICTYNPDNIILERCLNAISSLKIGDFSIEVILVDNNSSNPIIEHNYIKSFFQRMSNAKLIVIEKQGLSHARTGGIMESLGSQIVFFDDDNVPEQNYLVELHKLNKEYPLVAAWGPGIIDVEFIAPVKDELLDIAKKAFQERHETSVLYSNQLIWQDCYPFGTGLTMRREFCLAYIAAVKEGRFTLSGRQGDDLTSGEDTQMILYLVSQGAAAGVSPGMALKHIVPAKRTTLNYLSRLTYGTNLCYSTCVLEVFPAEYDAISSSLVKPNKFKLRVLKKLGKLVFDRRVKKLMSLVAYIGSVAGTYIALKKPVPPIAAWALRRLNIK